MVGPESGWSRHHQDSTNLVLPRRTVKLARPHRGTHLDANHSVGGAGTSFSPMDGRTLSAQQCVPGAGRAILRGKPRHTADGNGAVMSDSIPNFLTSARVCNGLIAGDQQTEEYGAEEGSRMVRAVGIRTG